MNADRQAVEDDGILLQPAARLRHRHALSLLLDVRDRDPPDSELYRPWRAVNNAPFWTLHPTLEHFQDLIAKTTFPHWLWNTFFIACASTTISLFCGLLAGYALAGLTFPLAGWIGS